MARRPSAEGPDRLSADGPGRHACYNQRPVQSGRICAILVWTSGQYFQSSRLESPRRCPMCGTRAARRSGQWTFGAPAVPAKMVEVPNLLKFLG